MLELGVLSSSVVSRGDGEGREKEEEGGEGEHA